MGFINAQKDETAEHITFGIEFECLVKTDRKDFEVGSYHHGIQVETMPNGWTAEKDASINALVGYTPVEIVSPILKGEAGLREAMQVADLLKNKYRARINVSCGFHVHIGIPPGLDTNGTIKQWLVNLISWTGRFEKALHASTGTTNRICSIHCKSVLTEYNLDYCRTRTHEDFADEYGNGRAKRYNILNVMPYFAGKNNVEFRVFQGTVESKKVAGYVQMCLGFVVKALKNGHKTYNKGTAKSVFPKQGEGRRDLERLFNTLKWRMRNGTVFGWILNTDEIDPIVEELRRLAGKFDDRVRSVGTFTDEYMHLQDMDYFE